MSDTVTYDLSACCCPPFPTGDCSNCTGGSAPPNMRLVVTGLDVGCVDCANGNGTYDGNFIGDVFVLNGSGESYNGCTWRKYIGFVTICETVRFLEMFIVAGTRHPDSATGLFAFLRFWNDFTYINVASWEFLDSLPTPCSGLVDLELDIHGSEICTQNDTAFVTTL